MSDSHCSDSFLIAFLDGELSIEQWQQCSQHLDACWRCRARASELEQTIVRINRIFSGADEAVGDSINRVQRQVMELIGGPVAGPGNAPLLRKGRPGRAVLLLSIAGIAAAAVTGIMAIRPPINEKPAVGSPLPVSTSAVGTLSPRASLSLPPLTVRVPGRISRLEPKMPAAVSLDDLEVEFRFALHRRGADLKNADIRIAKKNDHLVVTGVVDDRGDRDELAGGVKEISQPELVSLDVLIPSETGNNAPEASPIEFASAAKPPKQPFRPKLLALAGSEGRLTEIGNTAISQVEKMTDLAWALRHLDDRFGPATRILLKPGNRHLLQAMEADYIRDIQNLSGALKAGLSLLFTSPRLPGEEFESRNIVERVFATRDLVEWMFAGRPFSTIPGSFDSALQILATDLDRLARSNVTPRPMERAQEHQTTALSQ